MDRRSITIRYEAASVLSQVVEGRLVQGTG
jgi:hypothetical protein